jgi:UDP-glucose 4-epimerase
VLIETIPCRVRLGIHGVAVGVCSVRLARGAVLAERTQFHVMKSIALPSRSGVRPKASRSAFLSTEANPVNPPGYTKLAVERMVRDAEAAHGIRHVALRYFNAAGADPDGELGELHVPETHLIPLVLFAAMGASHR